MTHEPILVAILGDEGVGKSSLITQYVSRTFVETDPTIEDVYRTEVLLDEQALIVEIFDSTKEYTPFTDQMVRKASCFIFVYSLCSRATISGLQKYRQPILQHEGQDEKPILIIANKCDLETAREVSLSEGQKLATNLNCAFFETSAKENTNVENAFTYLLREVMKIRKETRVKSSFTNRRTTCYLL